MEDELSAIVGAGDTSNHVVFEAVRLHGAIDDADGVNSGTVIRTTLLGVSLSTPVVELCLGSTNINLRGRMTDGLEDAGTILAVATTRLVESDWYTFLTRHVEALFDC